MMVDEEFVLFAAEITRFFFASRARGIHPDAPQPSGLLCNPGSPHNLDVPASTARCPPLQVYTTWEISSSERRNSMGENNPVILPKYRIRSYI